MFAKDKMTSMERLLAVCRGEIPDRVPFVIASREFGMKQAGFSLSRAYSDPECYIDSQLLLREKYNTDLLWDIWASPVVDEAMGAHMIIPEDDSPYIDYHPFLNSMDEIDKVKRVDPYRDGRMPYMIDLVRALKKKGGRDVPVAAWVSQPFRTACMLRGEANLYVDMIRHPEAVMTLIELALEAQLAYAKALVEAGADIITTSNPVANQECISKKMYEKFSHPFTRRFFSACKEYGAKMTMFHTCGKWDDRFDLVTDENADILHLDRVELPGFKEKWSEKAVACGNLRTSETLLAKNSKNVYEETAECICSAKEGGKFILSANCAVPRDTPSQNMEAVVMALADHGYYDWGKER